MKALYVRIDDAQAETLDEAVARLGTTKQALVRTLLRTGLDGDTTPPIGAARVPSEPDPILTLSEVAALLRTDTEAILERVSGGDLPGRRLGNEWRFSRAAILDWLGGNEDGGRRAGFAP